MSQMVRRGIAMLLLAFAASTGSAAAQEDEGGGGGSFDIRSISAIAPLRTDIGPRTLQVYRSLIPNGYTLPTENEPAVGLWLSELSSGRAVNGRPMDDASHWMEGAVQIRVRHDATKTEGWYPIHYPVTAEAWFHLGRGVGLPKRRATGEVVQEGGGFTARVTPRNTTGGPSMSLGWRPAAGQDAGALQRAFRVPTDPLLVLNSALTGPNLEHVQYRIGPPSSPATLIPGGAPPMTAQSQPDGGLVTFDVRPMLDALQEPDLPKIFPVGTDLSDLIAVRQTVPGTHAYFAVDLASENKTIGQGGYNGSQPKIDPPRSPGSQKPRCAHRRSVTMRFRAARGARVRSIRAYVNGKRAKAKRVGKGRRVRVSLRRARGKRYRVTIVVQQVRAGERVRTRTTRSFRRCRS